LRKIQTILVVATAILVWLGIRAFQPPIPLAKLESLRKGVSRERVRETLGMPGKIYPGGREYSVRGTNYVTTEQWTYTRPLTFGYVNIHFDTNGIFSYHNYEEF